MALSLMIGAICISLGQRLSLGVFTRQLNPLGRFSV